MNELKFRNFRHEYAYARIVNGIPKVGDHVRFIYDDEIVVSIREALIDCEQPSRSVFNYEIYELEICDANNEEDIDFIYVATPYEG